MKEMHSYLAARQIELTAPRTAAPPTEKDLLAFLCQIRDWTQSAPRVHCFQAEGNQAVYVWFNGAAFAEQDFWEVFGGYLTVFAQTWRMDLFSTEPLTQEAVWIGLERREDRLLAVERTVSGRPAETVESLCLRIQCADPEQARTLLTLFRATDWDSGVIVVDWDLRSVLGEEGTRFGGRTCFCYGSIYEDTPPDAYLHALHFHQKKTLWMGLLRDGCDYLEFEWLYRQISSGELKNRMEWELSLNAALEELGYTVQLSQREFRLFDGEGRRRYFNFDSPQYSQRAVLKMLFPINT